MEPIGLGVDLIELARIRRTHERHGERFVKRVYTPVERERIARLKDPTTFLAGRFAAKEAVLKVLGTGLSGGISWQHVHVLREPSGAPSVRLSNAALERARRLGIGKILVSITHSRELAMAQALGFSGDPAALEYRSMPAP